MADIVLTQVIPDQTQRGVTEITVSSPIHHVAMTYRLQGGSPLTHFDGETFLYKNNSLNTEFGLFTFSITCYVQMYAEIVDIISFSFASC